MTKSLTFKSLARPTFALAALSFSLIISGFFSPTASAKSLTNIATSWLDSSQCLYLALGTYTCSLNSGDEATMVIQSTKIEGDIPGIILSFPESESPGANTVTLLCQNKYYTSVDCDEKAREDRKVSNQCDVDGLTLDGRRYNGSNGLSLHQKVEFSKSPIALKVAHTRTQKTVSTNVTRYETTLSYELATDLGGHVRITASGRDQVGARSVSKQIYTLNCKNSDN